jgi:DNA-binding CsgD family transcriptional regulator
MQLTTRQKEILDWIKRGASTKQIAKRLGVAESTVKQHVGKLLKTYGVKSRVALLTCVMSGVKPEDIKPMPPEDAKPCGWAKVTGGKLTGVFFGSMPAPDSSWQALYIRSAHNECD